MVHFYATRNRTRTIHNFGLYLELLQFTACLFYDNLSLQALLACTWCLAVVKKCTNLVKLKRVCSITKPISNPHRVVNTMMSNMLSLLVSVVYAIH
jgi:hypothetical protein